MTNKRIRVSLAASVSAVLAFGATDMAQAQTGRASAGHAPRQQARVAQLPAGSQRPTNDVVLSIGEGELVTLPANAADVWTSNPGTADVYVANPRQIHLFGKAAGEATVFATSANGAVIYSASVRVSQNISSIDKMLKAAMPEADISVTTVGQIAVLNGTVASPADSEQAQRLVTTLLNPGVDVSQPGAMLKIAVVNRLKTATPLQVNLQVKFAEVSRSFIKDVGVNTVTRDTTSGMQFSLGSGTRVPGTISSASTANLPVIDASSKFGFPAGTISLPYDPARGDFVYPGTGSAYTFTKSDTEHTSLGLAGKLLGLDVLSAIDLGERIGQVTTLANPNLTALSGETATFLAGGELPIPIAQGLGTTTIEYKQYGVSLAFTPTVLADGRISLRVKPEVSQLDAANSVTFGGTVIPAISTRRSETTIELGSGESMMIAGLLSNNHNNNITKAPGLGDVPILGALFRSNGFQRNETELVIVITPYLVKPVNANQIALPTDGYKAPNDFQRIFMGQLEGGKTGGDRPKPSMAPSGDTQPAVGAMTPAPIAPAPAKPGKKSAASAAPGFGL